MWSDVDWWSFSTSFHVNCRREKLKIGLTNDLIVGKNNNGEKWDKVSNWRDLMIRWSLVHRHLTREEIQLSKKHANVFNISHGQFIDYICIDVTIERSKLSA